MEGEGVDVVVGFVGVEGVDGCEFVVVGVWDVEDE